MDSSKVLDFSDLLPRTRARLLERRMYIRDRLIHHSN